MNFIFSPFVVPVAGCLVGVVAIVCGIWLDAHKRRLKSEERIAMISRGVPLAEIEKMLGVGDEDKAPVKDPMRSLGNARRTGIVLVSVGVGLVLFFLVLRTSPPCPRSISWSCRWADSVGHRYRLLHRLQPPEARAVALRVGGRSRARKLDGQPSIALGFLWLALPTFCSRSPNHAHWLHCFGDSG